MDNLWPSNELQLLDSITQFLAKIKSTVNSFPDLAAVAANLPVLSTGGTIPTRPNSISSTKPTASASGDTNPIRSVYSRLRTILPEQLDRELLAGGKDLSGLVSLDENAQYLSLAIYLISNNMLQAEDLSKVMAWLAHQIGRQLFRALLSVKTPAINAFAEKLLLAAAKAENSMVIKEVLKAGTDPNIWGGDQQMTPLYYFAERGNNDLAIAFLNAGADVNIQAVEERASEEEEGKYWTVLQVAASRGNIEMVQILLVAGADVNAPPADWGDGRTALQAAAEKGNIKLVQVLLDAGADVNAPPTDWNGRTALQAAAEEGSIKLVKVLLTAGANVNAPPAPEDGRTAIRAAVGKGNIELIKVLLTAGANINAPPAGVGGRTALQAAAEKGNIELFQVLLAAGANVNAPPAPKDGRTALQAAAEKGNIELIKVLLVAGADFNAPPAYDNGVTALQASAIKGYVGIALMLLDAGADVNARASPIHGRTALEGAAEHGRIDMVQLLFNAGVELGGPRDSRYRKILKLVSQNGHNTVKKLIENHYEAEGNE